MPSFRVETPQRSYDAVVERGAVRRIQEFLPAKCGKIFVVTTKDVWDLHGESFAEIPHHAIFFPGGEARKRIAEVEVMAEQMLAMGADRSSVVVAFGGGIVNDTGGFLAAIFMRGIPVIADSDHAAGAGGCGGRRENGRKSDFGKKPAGQFSSASGSADRSRCAAHFAGKRISRGAVRNHQMRRNSRCQSVPVVG